MFPVGVAEKVGYDQGHDRVTHTETLEFVTVRPGGNPEAPLPPMLALAWQYGAPVSFSAPPVDTGLATVFGPLVTIKGTGYSWSLKGQRRIIQGPRTLGPPNRASKPLEEELAAEVDKILAAGHLTPMVWGKRNYGTVYWADPSEQLYFLSEILPLLQKSRAQKLVQYMKDEREKYLPESVRRMSVRTGTRRVDWDTRRIEGGLYEQFGGWQSGKPGGNEHMPRYNNSEFPESKTVFPLSIYRAYGLSRYYDATDENPDDDGVLDFCENRLQYSLSGRQWDTLGWFWGKYTCIRNKVKDVLQQYTPRCVNRDLAGVIGCLRLYQHAGKPAPSDAWGHFARLAVLRYAILHYACFQAKAGSGGSPRNDAIARSLLKWADFRKPENLVYQPLEINQYGVVLTAGASLSMGFGAFHVTFLDMVPEVGKLLREWGGRESVRRYLERIDARHADWYRAEAAEIDGTEWQPAHMADAHQLFMAHAWIAKTTPDRLARLADVPVLDRGDLFYLHKLAETIKAYRTVAANR